MAESPSSALPGGVQWLPAIGGAHLLRAEVGRGEPPTLVLQSARGEEHRITAGPQTRFNRSADFLIPAGLRWAVAVLVWQDGTRAVLPDPPAGRAEVIDLASRRVPLTRPARPNARHPGSAALDGTALGGVRRPAGDRRLTADRPRALVARRRALSPAAVPSSTAAAFAGRRHRAPVGSGQRRNRHSRIPRGAGAREHRARGRRLPDRAHRTEGRSVPRRRGAVARPRDRASGR